MQCIKPYEAKGPTLITPERIDEGILGWIRFIAREVVPLEKVRNSIIKCIFDC